MSTQRASLAAVRWLARFTGWLYPAKFRRSHAHQFADVAGHLLAREKQRGPIAAALVVSRVILADAVSASLVMWREEFTHGDESMPRAAVRNVRQFVGQSGHDIYLAARAIVRRPGLTAMVVLTLGLGLGASTAAFDALDRTIVRPFPFPHGEQLTLLVMEETPHHYMTGVPPDAFNAWRDRATTTAGVEMFRRSSAIVMTADGSDVREGISMSGGLPQLLGVKAVRGRTFTSADAAPSAPAVVMLGEAYWRSQFGGDPSTIGRMLTVGNAQMQVIGIWPSGARLDFFETPEVFRVLPARNEYNPGGWVQIVARVKPGYAMADVANELSTLVPPPATKTASSFTVKVVPPSGLLLAKEFVTGVWLVFAGALVLLAAAIANASHLLVERAAGRWHELGVRLSLGASRNRLFRLFLTEGIVYGVLSLGAGAAIAIGLEQLIARVEPRLYRDAAGAGLFGRAFLFAAGTSLFATLVCAIAPLARAGRRDLSGVLAQGQHRVVRTRSRGTQALVAAQAGLAVLLVFGAAIMGKSLRNLLNVDPGLEVARLAEMSVSLPKSRFPSGVETRRYLDAAMASLRALPGVTNVVKSDMPIMQSSMVNGVPTLEGDPPAAAAQDRTTAIATVTADYFETLGLRILQGRSWTEHETGVAVVSELFAKSRGGDVIGRRLALPGERPGDPHYTIIGVMNDVRYMGLSNDTANQPAVLLPATDTLATDAQPERFARFIARTNGDPADVIKGARRAFAAIDPRVPLLAPGTGTENFQRQTSEFRFVAVLLAGLALVGFSLAMMGVYGAVALRIVRLRREMGLRMALGATAERLVWKSISDGLQPVIVGAVVGTFALWIAAPRIETLLFRVPPRDPASVLLGLGLVLTLAALTALLPARRIAAIDPAKSLREAD